MAETFVEVGMEVVGDEEIFVEKIAGGLVDDKFLVESVAMGCVIICTGDILDCYGF